MLEIIGVVIGGACLGIGIIGLVAAVSIAEAYKRVG
jgi:hypothetical protein